MLKNKYLSSLIVANIIIHILEEHPEKIVVQWLEIEEHNGGLGLSASRIGESNSASALLSVAAFYFIFPDSNRPDYTANLLKMVCFTEGILLISIPFFRYIHADYRILLYFFWNLLHSGSTNIIYGVLFIINSQVVNPELLGSFYSNVKLIGGLLSVVLYALLGYTFEIVLKNRFVVQIFGKVSTILFFGPFGLLFIYFWKKMLDSSAQNSSR